MRKDESDLVEELTPILQEAVDRCFSPGFADRVVARIHSETDAPVIPLTATLKGQFVRLVPLAAAVLIALGAYNLLGAGTTEGQSPVEAALGLQPVTLEDAYAFEQTFYPTDGD